MDPNISTSFTITITAIGQSNLILAENTTFNSFYIFSRSTLECVVYRFVVVATNGAGVSQPVAITKGLPSLHLVEISLQHSVMRNDDEITHHP